MKELFLFIEEDKIININSIGSVVRKFQGLNTELFYLEIVMINGAMFTVYNEENQKKVLKVLKKHSINCD